MGCSPILRADVPFYPDGEQAPVYGFLDEVA